MSTVTVRIPTPLRGFTDGADELLMDGNDVGEVLAALGSRYDGLLEQILTPEGEPRPFVNIYLGRNDVRSLEGMTTPVTDRDVLSILPAVAGGVQ